MRTIFETKDGRKLYYYNNKFYTSHPEEVIKALQEDLLEVPTIILPLMQRISETGGLRQLAQYVWLSFESETGSIDSKLVMNGNYPLDVLIEELRAIPAKELIASCPSWIKLKQVRLSCQNIFSSKVLWRRTININKITKN